MKAYLNDMKPNLKLLGILTITNLAHISDQSGTSVQNLAIFPYQTAVQCGETSYHWVGL